MKVVNTGDDIPDRVVWVSLAKEDLQALLRVARAGKDYIEKMWMKNTNDITESHNEYIEARKEADHLL